MNKVTAALLKKLDQVRLTMGSYSEFQQAAETELHSLIRTLPEGRIVLFPHLDLPLWLAASRLEKRGVLKRNLCFPNNWQLAA